jgi:ribonuclease R
VSLKSEIMAALAGKAEGLSEAELLRVMGLPKHLKGKIQRDLSNLQEQGLVQRTSRHLFRATAHGAKAQGKGAGPSGAFQAVFSMSGSGIGFAKDANKQEYFIPERLRGWALPGDTVELKLSVDRKPFKGKKDDNRKPVAEVVRVVTRGRAQWVGKLRREARDTYVDVRLGELELEMDCLGVPAEVPDGHWVVMSPPGLDVDGKDPAPGRFISHLGGEGTPHLDTLILIKKHALKEDFDEATVAESEAFPPAPPEADKAGRLDLRGTITFTIDGADAKDFDDAVSLERDGKGWILGVHIADVANYVKPGTALDKEGYERATSVYLPDRVLPMLPEALSNGLCSLKPDVDRLTMSALMNVDEKGRITGARFANSVIHSSRRFTYEQVEDYLNGKTPLASAAEEARLGPVLKNMQAVAKQRRKLREQRGALDFDFPETKVTLDDTGKPIELTRRARLFAHQLIEEFMLAANESVATELREAGFPVLYRVHEEPDPDKLADTMAYLGTMKLGAPKGNLTPKDLQKLMAQVEGKPQQRLVHTLILRSLRLARYTPGHDMHFGLALADYCHFTSPIRRYPDLVVHRMLKERLAGKSPSEVKKKYGNLEEAGLHTSTMERKAEACERDCVKAKQVRFLSDKVGMEYPATITSVTHFGFFCEIDPFPAEGLVPLGSLHDDFYDYDRANYCLVGARKKRRIQIGDKLNIIVKRADWEALQVDFEAIFPKPGLA